MIKENQRIFNGIAMLTDACICMLSMAFAYILRFNILEARSAFALELPYYMRLMTAIVPVYFLLYHYFNLHDSFRAKSLVKEIGQIIQANLLGVLSIFLLAFFLKQVDVSRLMLIFFAGFNTVFCTAERIAIRKTLRYMRSKGFNLKHMLLVGWNEASGEFYDRIRLKRELGYVLEGYLSPQQEDLEGRPLTYRGSFAQLPKLLENKQVDEVIISLDYDEFPYLGEIIDTCEKAGVKSSLLPFYTKYLPTKPYIDEVEGLPLINLRHIPLDNFLNRFMKRALDFFASAAGLLVLSPVLLVTAIGVKLSSPGPIIYKQERIGRNKKVFTMYKFRSMAVEGNEDKTTWGTKKDGRRTSFGTFIRKFSIDELPQLFNVLVGDMSLVGPRPERPFFVDKFREEIPLYMMKHLVRPGITGWAQINGWRGDTSIEERIKCDLYYIENWTFLLDIKILFITVFKGVVNKSETW